jgi:ketosteroid isomerase-like protein
MTVKPADRALVERYFRAMQTGPDGTDELVGLFADDAVYVEPFSGNGQAATHHGKAAIAAVFRGMTDRVRDLVVTVHQIVLDGNQIRSEWTCTAAAFPGPVRGHDLYTIREGKIARLETILASPANASSA